MSSVFDHTHHEVYLVSALWQQRRWGFVATWVFPLTLASEHKHFVVAISPMSTTLEAIKGSGRLGLQMLAVGQQHHVVSFGCLASKHVDKYAGLALESSSLPFLSGSVGCIEAKVMDIFSTHERQLVYCRSEVSWVCEPHKSPLRTGDLKELLGADELEKLSDRRKQLVKESHERFGSP
ncbi:MAG: flavin reductase [Proteobacteria bacterium]|nr:flavin reductase [Pseudomonadota bacterium]